MNKSFKSVFSEEKRKTKHKLPKLAMSFHRSDCEKAFVQVDEVIETYRIFSETLSFYWSEQQRIAGKRKTTNTRVGNSAARRKRQAKILMSTP